MLVSFTMGDPVYTVAMNSTTNLVVRLSASFLMIRTLFAFFIHSFIVYLVICGR